MRKVVYDVATSGDGFIARPDGSVPGFLFEGDHVTDYMARIATYDTVLMGRATYEWGYQFGLQPGKRSYLQLRHCIFSKTLQFGAGAEVEVIAGDAATAVAALKAEPGGSIYLCGGGALAASLLERELIDELVLKINPLIYGEGVPLFGNSTKQVGLALRESKPYTNGVILAAYDIVYRG